jgi:hypothetical protein
MPSFLLLIACTFLLPACGGNEIKGQKPPETVLNAESSPTPDATQIITMGPSPNGVAVSSNPKTGFNFDTPNRPVEKSVARSYKEKIERVKGPQSIQTVQVVTTPTPETSAAVSGNSTPTASQPSQPPMEANANNKPKGSHWFIWLIVLAVLGGGAYWYWSHRHEDETPYQPQPPVGGLSPVSGFTARKNKTETKKTSFWNRKLF